MSFNGMMLRPWRSVDHIAEVITTYDRNGYGVYGDGQGLECYCDCDDVGTEYEVYSNKPNGEQRWKSIMRLCYLNPRSELRRIHIIDRLLARWVFIVNIPCMKEVRVNDKNQFVVTNHVITYNYNSKTVPKGEEL
ncbi:AAEL004190-PA [Aedes aegypti]|uniref:AAEL004190-PA n=1 Tax=Aedes aegypti TaxID=7159 RepID=Q16ZU6_AEDAE|nr:AAEL008074-PA [Aedes aegypti]EAT44430.1 AAEL004190-PA [Aedes aegypti]